MCPLTAPTIKKLEFHKSKMADGRHFEIRNGLTDLYEIWYADAKWVS